jgi:prolyl 4-hydroxylase
VRWKLRKCLIYVERSLFCEVWFFFEMIQLSKNIFTVDAFLSADECSQLIALAKGRLKPSSVVDSGSGVDGRNDRVRVSESVVTFKGENSLVSDVERKISVVAGCPVSHLENLQLTRYGPGGFYVPHDDFFEFSNPAASQILKRGGQRVATFVIYLNTPLMGGTTDFPRLGVEVQPEEGKALFFTYPNMDRTLFHGGSKVVAGEKWILVTWVRQSRFL